MLYDQIITNAVIYFISSLSGALLGFYAYHRAIKTKLRINNENWERQTKFNDLLLACAKENENNIQELCDKYNSQGVTLEAFQNQMNDIKLELSELSFQFAVRIPALVDKHLQALKKFMIICLTNPKN